MIEEAYVSFETAKLLKEKGFNEKVSRWYVANSPQEGVVTIGFGDKQLYINAPTQQMAMKWLREVHKMYVCIDIKCFMPHLGEIDGYSACIWYKPENNAGICCYCVYLPKQQEASYEAATEAAIKYSLENLI